jgi:hypothetical protein
MAALAGQNSAAQAGAMAIEESRPLHPGQPSIPAIEPLTEGTMSCDIGTEALAAIAATDWPRRSTPTAMSSSSARKRFEPERVMGL